MRASIVMLTVGLVGACGGQQIAAGPVFGYVAGRGFSAGWEAGGGPMRDSKAYADPAIEPYCLFTRASTGMSWRPVARDSARSERISYFAWEPWYLLGGTMGLAHSSEGPGLRQMIGVWEAAPWIIGAPRREASAYFYHCSPCYTVSVALGWRWSDAGEFYITPKLGILNGVTMPFPYQTYAD